MMTAIRHSARRWLRDRVEAEAYVASVCFKHGPPRLLGVELEWTVHHAADLRRPLEAAHLVAALGPHAPATLVPDSPQLCLPAGSPLTIEPGGQVEISALPKPSLTELIDTVDTDLAYLTGLLADAGLVLGARGLDPHRPPRRILSTPRYDAMEKVFAPIGPHGLTMMCSSAGLQVCLDVGEPADVPDRWAAISGLGPVLAATFANSSVHAGEPTGWASARTRTVLATDPARTAPVPTTEHPATAWAARVLDTPVICLRASESCWDAPPGMTFADWMSGALPRPPTTDDLDLHISTQFPPVRAQGYFEVRYLDAQPGADWIVPVALLVALFADRDTVRSVARVCAPVADRWLPAARCGLTDPPIAQAAATVLDLGLAALPATGLAPHPAARVTDALRRLRHTALTTGG